MNAPRRSPGGAAGQTEQELRAHLGPGGPVDVAHRWLVSLGGDDLGATGALMTDALRDALTPETLRNLRRIDLREWAWGSRPRPVAPFVELVRLVRPRSRERTGSLGPVLFEFTLEHTSCAGWRVARVAERPSR